MFSLPRLARVLSIMVMILLIAGPAKAQKKRIGVVILKKGGSVKASTVNDLVEVMLATVLKTGKYVLVGKSQILAKLGRDANACVESDTCLKGVATTLRLDFVVVAQLSKEGSKWNLAVRRAFPGKFRTQKLSYQIVGGLGELIKGIQSSTDKVLSQPMVLPKPKVKLVVIYLKIMQDGAQVFVNNKNVGISPLEKVILPRSGPCAIEIRKTGFVPFKGNFQCEDGNRFVITKLAKKVIVKKPKKPKYRTKMSTYRLTAWITLGVGVALTATGGALLGVAKKQNSSLNSKCDDATVMIGNTPVCDITQSDARSEKGSIETKLKAGYALLIVGGLTLATSVAFFFLKPTVRERIVESNLNFAPVVTGDTFGFAASLKF